jgi:hypothetical protein
MPLSHWLAFIVTAGLVILFPGPTVLTVIGYSARAAGLSPGGRQPADGCRHMGAARETSDLNTGFRHPSASRGTRT